MNKSFSVGGSKGLILRSLNTSVKTEQSIIQESVCNDDVCYRPVLSRESSGSIHDSARNNDNEFELRIASLERMVQKLSDSTMTVIPFINTKDNCDHNNQTTVKYSDFFCKVSISKVDKKYNIYVLGDCHLKCDVPPKVNVAITQDKGVKEVLTIPIEYIDDLMVLSISPYDIDKYIPCTLYIHDKILW